ncbi:MAG TPA: hypothetical protein VMR86_12990 [Myxococcota bacterium]|nr:hypothetical protein [Myxococcota bacterium]
MAVRFPSLEFFQALKQRTLDDKARFEKLGYCDTTFGVRIGNELFAVAFEVYECTGVSRASDSRDLDFVLEAPPELWREMVASIIANGGADPAHTLNTLSHVGDRMKLESNDAEGNDKFYRFQASLQEFFDQARNLEVTFPTAGRVPAGA